MKIYYISVACFLVLCPLLGGCSASIQKADPQMGDYPYGKVIDYLDGKVKKLPDISIRFLGERREPSPAYTHGFIYEDFEVQKGAETQKVSWTAGTGDIGPAFFDAGGQQYALDLAQSDIYGNMKPGEMIVWTRAEYDKQVSMRKNKNTRSALH
jgi:hypothetical protein